MGIFLMTLVILLSLAGIFGLFYYQRAQVNRQFGLVEDAKNDARPEYRRGIWCRCHPPLGLHPIDEPLEAGDWRFT